MNDVTTHITTIYVRNVETNTGNKPKAMTSSMFMIMNHDNKNSAKILNPPLTLALTLTLMEIVAVNANRNRNNNNHTRRMSRVLGQVQWQATAESLEAFRPGFALVFRINCIFL